MATVIQVQDINTKDEYSYEEGSDFFIDENRKLVHIVTSGYDENEHPNDMCIEIQGSAPDFIETYRVLYSLSFDQVKSLDMHRQVLEMEADLDYMKSHGEHGSNCSDCEYNYYDVTVEPCTSCVDYCNYSKMNILPTNPDFEPNEIKDMVKENINFSPTYPETLDNTIEYHPADVLHNNIKSTTMNDICGPLKEAFNIHNKWDAEKKKWVPNTLNEFKEQFGKKEYISELQTLHNET